MNMLIALFVSLYINKLYNSDILGFILQILFIRIKLKNLL